MKLFHSKTGRRDSHLRYGAKGCGTSIQPTVARTISLTSRADLDEWDHLDSNKGAQGFNLLLFRLSYDPKLLRTRICTLYNCHITASKQSYRISVYLFRHRNKQVVGIEPTCLAWKANILPLNYTCKFEFRNFLKY